MRNPDEGDNSIIDNIAHDADLDYKVETNIDQATWAGLLTLAEREHGGNRAAAVRACIINVLRTRYLIA